MSCTQTLTNIDVDCGSNMGGTKEVYAQNRTAVANITVTDGKVTGFTMANDAPQAAKYSFRKNASGLKKQWTIAEDSGNKFVTSTMNMRFSKMDTAKRVSIMAMANAEMYIIVKDRNGKYWLLGYDDPVTMTDGTGDTGTQGTDANEYTVVLSDQSTELPYEVDAAAVATFINAPA